ncbi:hypothetical protein CROQUDRAFT_666065 [Cronartium quercuum f. sp. fusiforme G11]|uniref:Mitochondrial aspartate-glutamate transporter AGC1 n=1 Tax=Cronartium quercuum f. sp. fusiforme G11 TaxID=708437 RepID=A0A9P6T5N7_9BASI|nr:hypothetical protein CROQUDRAFT_666065 [Cronartium quercuum f. sp. fusiforme G11]
MKNWIGWPKVVECESVHISPTDKELLRWKEVFEQFAKNKDYLDEEGFINAVAPINDFTKIKKSQYLILFKIADINKLGKVRWNEFVVFQNLLKKPDAQFEVAFKYFDQDSNGDVTFDEFKRVFSENLGPDSLPFTFDSQWVKLFLGRKDGDRHVLGYNEFTQLMKGLQGERLRQAFAYFDQAGTGHISPDQFKRIILELARHKLSDAVIERLPTLCTLTKGGKISYSEANAFHNVIGATAVYPIDLVKTRMQNQRSKVVGELLYKNSLDCVNKVFKNEGFSGFYRGLPPQLIGVAPEKAIKLTINDLIRSNTTDQSTGKISLGWEMFAGGAAGGCQVAVTNPLEIVKIRLQMQGELARVVGNEPKGALHIIRQLGLIGLYKGAGACLCRDIPFSAIYFTSYAHLKKDTFGEGLDGKKLGFGELLSAAAIAGMPAAYLTTPADVVKTRLQSEARKGETAYKGLIDCFTTILKEEGPQALFKGGPARILRSSPQFGVTLVSYEYLQKLIPYPFGQDKKVQVNVEYDDLPRIRARNAMKILLDVHEDFGIIRRST